MGWNSSTVSVGDPTEKADYDRLMDNTIYLKSGATEFTGEKTFQSSTVFNQAPDWRGVGEEIDYISQSGTATVVNLKKKIMEIGAWDMDGTQNIAIAHGLSGVNIVGVEAYIISDSVTVFSNLQTFGQNATGSIEWSTTEITVERIAGSVYDDAAYNRTDINRGMISILYF